MIRYSRVMDGVLKNQWTSDFADAKYIEPGWGSPKTYQIISEDITAEIDAKKAVDANRKLAIDKLKTFDKSKVSADELPGFIEAILMVQGMK